MSLLAQVFDEDGALENLEKFTSLNGPKHYGLKPNNTTITLEKSGTPVCFPSKIETKDGPVSVFDPAQEIFWNVKSD
jgi:dihydroorotase